MDRSRRELIIAAGLGGTILLLPRTGRAQKKYDEGASDTEIKIGNCNPYSGPASSYSTIGKCEAAFFRMVNQQGGINGRKITFISYDVFCTQPKTVEQVRKLIDNDLVLFLFNSPGTPPNPAVLQYITAQMLPMSY